ncbi:hypothetical protein CRN32_05700 [Vibrio vulnificus]|uniref:hypothetical protein n=1 Tax=Vibrio TaxID=662 RepID=UPI00084B567E|nr:MULTISPECIES: hypothetical protein [Vibrio]EHV2843322.1 hypothetical protein [Vibrio vulnificus]ELM6618683.1 hypothetical protein [Vibrio vulnificus]ELP3505678.1 hypothetical protein [Vibrio vulnificus]ELP3554529.1 hypothetical protein [Vibrio vulnificus]ELP7003200.1 hypothetical protein [Vibrio vulnificus]
MNNKYVAFYPSRPYWAIGALEVDTAFVHQNFTELMSEIVYQKDGDDFDLAICRDGRIMLNLKACDKNLDTGLDKVVERWNIYLGYLNSFYLLLDSAAIGVMGISYFSLHEITNRDAFPLSIENGKVISESISSESIASTYQMARYLSSYRQGIPLSIDTRLSSRHVINVEAIELAASNFEKLFSISGMQKELSSISKSISEYKVGNYETSVILSWFCTEKIVSHQWNSHLISLDRNFGDNKRINSKRLKQLTDRDYTISIIINMLELWGVLPFELYKDIEKVRVARNKIAHGDSKYIANSADACLAINSALDLVNIFYKIQVKPSLGFQVSVI